MSLPRNFAGYALTAAGAAKAATSGFNRLGAAASRTRCSRSLVLAHPAPLIAVVGGRLLRVSRAIASRRGHDGNVERLPLIGSVVLHCIHKPHVMAAKAATYDKVQEPHRSSHKHRCSRSLVLAHPDPLIAVVGGRLFARFTRHRFATRP